MLVGRSAIEKAAYRRVFTVRRIADEITVLLVLLLTGVYLAVPSLRFPNVLGIPGLLVVAMLVAALGYLCLPWLLPYTMPQALRRSLPREPSQVSGATQAPATYRELLRRWTA
jgi:hypothetical protein